MKMASLKLITGKRLIQTQVIFNSWLLKCVPTAAYAKKIGMGETSKGKGGGGGPMTVKKKLPVETDPHRLVNYVCGTNLLKEGGEDVNLKPDSEYPDWLWKLRLEGSPNLDELDPNTLDYWLVLRNKARKRQSVIRKWKKF